MILTINDYISIPLVHFYDSVNRNGEGHITRTATATFDKEKFDYSKVNDIMELMDSDHFDLIVTENEAVVWSSSDFNKIEIYSFELNLENPSTERNNLIFSII